MKYNTYHAKLIKDLSHDNIRAELGMYYKMEHRKELRPKDVLRMRALYNEFKKRYYII